MSGNTGLLLLCETELGKTIVHPYRPLTYKVTGKPMYEIPTGNSNAQQEAEKFGAKSTLGVGRTAPVGWMDGKSVHESLNGVQMVSKRLKDIPHNLP